MVDIYSCKFLLHLYKIVNHEGSLSRSKLMYLRGERLLNYIYYIIYIYIN